MIRKLIGFITALSITTSGLIALDTPATVHSTETVASNSEVKPYDENSMAKDSLSTLKIIATSDPTDNY